MGMLPTIFSEIPRWATDSGRTLEPAESVKDNGWSDSDKPPARFMNWIHNQTYLWLRNIAALALGNWQQKSVQLSGSGQGRIVIFHPTMQNAGLWMAADSVGDMNKSNDGRNWVAATSLLGKGCVARTKAIDSSNIIFGESSTPALQYTSNSGVSWTADSGISLTPAGMCSKYPDSDFLMICGTSPYIEIAASGVGTSWVSPTTAPAHGNLVALVRLASTTWLCVSASGYSVKSTDDGDNWADTAAHPNGTALTTAVCMAYDEGHSVLAVGGSDGSSNPIIAWSDDSGATWNEATIVDGEQVVSVDTLYACGAGMWYAHGDITGTAYGSEAGLVSVDDGQTWYPASYINSVAVTHSDVNDVSSDGKMLIGIRDDARTIQSLTLPGSMNG